MPVNREVSISGGYQPFQLKRDYHLDIFGNAVDKITQQHEKALEEENNILAAINKVPLNEADAPYKQQLLDYVKDRVSKASMFGNLSSAVTEVKQLAGEIASNPELLARAQRNEQYQTWRKDIEDRAKAMKIDQRTAERLIEQNPYNFIPQKDKNGNVIGGYDWRDTGGIGGTKTPTAVDKISLENILKTVDSIVAANRRGGSGYSARNAKGENIGLYSNEAKYYTKSSGAREWKAESTLQAVFDELKEQHPEIAAYISQMKADDVWEIEKLKKENKENPNNVNFDSNEAKINALRKKVYTENGLQTITDAQYLNNLSKHSIAAMAYVNTNSDVTLSRDSNNVQDPNHDNETPLKNTDFSTEGIQDNRTNNGVKKTTANATDAMKAKYASFSNNPLAKPKQQTMFGSW